ncbi:hypothetical protein MNBD_PLANCTO03-1770 [hydrothermal vent metagenome]|uniref:Uncharacterized protein n=1 Tax=hydrothermal vent metagenome TaxID=652676 RepID=A0A3B1DJ69_9ZZZZ
MFAKIVVVILALGICACSLLALRQARLQAANELAEARLRVRTIDERVSIVRAVIAGSVTPEQVEEMTRQVAMPMVPMALQEEHTADAPGAENGATLVGGGR